MNHQNEGDGERRIMVVFSKRKAGDIPPVGKASLAQYSRFLARNLLFPLRGRVTQEAAPFPEESTPVVLHALGPHDDDFYGLLAEGERGGERIVIALAA